VASTFIYGLKDPVSNKIRYVGKSNNPKSRLSRHICEAKEAKSVHRLCWIKGLLNIGKKPILVILEKCDVDVWGERENYWISIFPNLTNMIDGGKFCPMLIPEIVAKMKESSKGKKHSKETRQKWSVLRKQEWDSGTRARNFRERTDAEKSAKSKLMADVWNKRSFDDKKAVGVRISNSKKKKVIGIDVDGAEKYNFNSAKMASSYFNLSPDRVARCCREGIYCRKSQCYWKWASDEIVVNQINN